MLQLALACFVISILAGLVGFSGMSRALAGMAKILFFVTTGIFVLLVVLTMAVGSLIL